MGSRDYIALTNIYGYLFILDDIFFENNSLFSRQLVNFALRALSMGYVDRSMPFS